MNFVCISIQHASQNTTFKLGVVKFIEFQDVSFFVGNPVPEDLRKVCPENTNIGDAR